MFSGILSITPSATAGTATVSAECDEITACDTKWEIFNNTEGMSNDGTLTVSDSTNDYIAVVKVFGENKNLLKKIRLLSVN